MNKLTVHACVNIAITVFLWRDRIVVPSTASTVIELIRDDFWYELSAGEHSERDQFLLSLFYTDNFLRKSSLSNV